MARSYQPVSQQADNIRATWLEAFSHGDLMLDDDLLFTIAEVAAAFAGFSTLVAVISERLASESSRLGRARIFNMLCLSLMVVIFALLPRLLSHVELGSLDLWRVSSTVYATVWVVYFVWALYSFRSGGGGFQLRTIAPLNVINILVVYPVTLTALILNAVGTWEAQSDVVYVGALFVMLILSATLFLQIVSLVSSD